MSDFSSILDLEYYKSLRTKEEKLDYLIENKIYAFATGKPQFDNVYTPFFERPDKVISYFQEIQNLVYKAGIYYIINYQLIEEFTKSLKEYVFDEANEISESIIEEFTIDWSIIIDERERLLKIKAQHQNILEGIINDEFKRKLYISRIKEDDFTLYQTVKEEIWEDLNKPLLINYLFNGKFHPYDKLPTLLKDFHNFEIEIATAEKLLELINHKPKSFVLKNVENDHNRFPEIFNTSFDCEFFFFCIDNFQEITKRTYSIFFQWFSTQEKIKQYRGVKTEYQKFICTNFESISKIEAGIDRYLDREFDYLKKKEKEFKDKL